MASKQIPVNVNECFTKQQATKDILTAQAKGPVPEKVLYRLLRVAELAVRDELERVRSEKKLVGLQLGYQIPKVGSKDMGEMYTVEWGTLHQTEKAEDSSEHAEEDESETGPDENPLSLEFIYKLIERLEEAMEKYTLPVDLDGCRLRVSIRGLLNSTPVPFQLWCDCWNEEKNAYCWREYKNGKEKCTKTPCHTVFE